MSANESHELDEIWEALCKFAGQHHLLKHGDGPRRGSLDSRNASDASTTTTPYLFSPPPDSSL